MRPLEKWIWLPRAGYPFHQETAYSAFIENPEARYAVACFTKTYRFAQAVASLSVRVSGDTAYRLDLNGRRIAAGPASAGGDFLFNELPRPNHYADRVEIAGGDTALSSGEVAFRAEVQTQPCRMFEFSRGRGGFMLTAHITFADGTKTVISSDETWEVSLLNAYRAPGEYAETELPAPAVPAELIPNVWFAEDSPILVTREEIIPVLDGVRVDAGQTLEAEIPLDRIYACHALAAADGPMEVEAQYYETDPETAATEHYIFQRGSAYEGFHILSVGAVRVRARNLSGRAVTLRLSLAAVCYPADFCARTEVSDAGLNKVLDVCAHTLKYCRQTLHLDSPKHCEPLACTGDYYIEMLMTAFTFGDMRLAAFDIRRTAELLRYHDGRMFHTSYSLIWVQMAWDYYMLTGDRDLLGDCFDALTLLLTRFEGYLGANGLIETPPDYMFVDWLNPDGISMHHPPKALGQSCLNMFYFGALRTAAKIFNALGEDAMAQKQLRAADALDKAIVLHLYDPARGLFFAGLNTPTPEALLAHYMPQNTDKRYYFRHANILAAYFGLLSREDCRALLKKVYEDESLGPVQPYFMHFWLEAIYRNGLREEYTLPLIDLWKAPVAECDKGLTEGFYKPEPTYSFDHSHAWGGTPACSLPLALSGLEIIRPGYEQIVLDPCLLGLARAHVEIPTPRGLIVIDMEKGKAPEISVPPGITLVPAPHRH